METRNPTSARMTGAARNVDTSKEGSKGGHGVQLLTLGQNSTSPDYLNVDIEKLMAEAVENESMCDNAS